MKYEDVPTFGVTVGVPQASQDDYFTFANVVTKDEPRKHVIMRLGNGTFDGERKTFILMENRDNVLVLLRGDFSLPGVDGLHSIVMRHLGSSVSFVWSDRFQTWYVDNTGSTILTWNDFANSALNSSEHVSAL